MDDKVIKEKLLIELNDYSYHCGDGCCLNYGTITKVNGVELELNNTDTATIVTQILTHLGYEVEIKKMEDGKEY